MYIDVNSSTINTEDNNVSVGQVLAYCIEYCCFQEHLNDTLRQVHLWLLIP